MPSGQLSILLHHIRHWASGSKAYDPADEQLLDRFVRQRDEAAFALLVERHGPMVLRVCRRVLGDHHAAEDAFQATFLVLVRKAGAIGRRELLGNWLYGVAYRTAARAKVEAAKRQRPVIRPEPRPSVDPVAEVSGRELCAVLDEELNRLPAHIRGPFRLCYVEGQTRDQAAHQLGCSVRTLQRRLEQGRQLLQARLTRRGLTLSAALLTTALAQQAGSATLPVQLVASTAQAAFWFAAGPAARGGTVSAEAAALAESVLHSMAITKLRFVMALLLFISLVTSGAGGWIHHLLVAKPVPGGQEEPRIADRGTESSKPEASPQARTDLYGDPLPAGALVRMGTVRLRQYGPRVVFSPDGKTLISAGVDHMVRTWDMATGKYLRARLLEGTQHLGWSAVTFAPDGKALVVWRYNLKSLPVYEVAGGKELGRIPVRDAQLYRLALGPGGRLLATATNDTLDKHFIHLWDVATGSERRLLEHGLFDEALAFSPDGKLLGAAGRDDTVRLWDVATAKLLHNLPAEARCLTFSPDSKTVASGNMDGSVKLWDIATGKERATLKATPAHDIQCLAFSPDAKVLAAGGQGGLRLWDVAARKEVRQLPDRMVYWLAFAPDGKTLSATGGCNIRLWEVATGRQLFHRPGHDDHVDAIALSPDGKVVASTSYGEGTLCLWDAGTGKLLHRPPGSKIAGRFTCFSPDGKLVASGGQAVYLWETATGKQGRRLSIEELTPDKQKPYIEALCFSPDGTRLIAISRSELRDHCQINVWETATGKLLTRRKFDGDAFSCFTPDAGGVTLRTAQGLAIQNTLTGKELVTIPGIVDLWPIAFSPDGKRVAVVRRPVPAAGKGAGLAHAAAAVTAVSVAQVATGKEVVRIETGPPHCLAFSEDGRVLAIADDNVVRLWEVATGKEVFRRPRHEELPGAPAQAAVTSVALLPGGRTLATGQMDGTILVWDLAPDTVAVKELSPGELDGLWADLAGNDARKAYQAINSLAVVPAQCVPFLKDHLRPAPEADARRVKRLITDLNSDMFRVRDAATKELAKMGEEVEPALRKALEEKPSLEARRRLEALLAGPHTVPPGPTLRGLRAIQILEQIGSPEAQAVLRRLATGSPASRETREADETLKRLAKQPSAKP